MARTLDFGKHNGKQIHQCETGYLRWLATHEQVLAKRNQWASRDAKFALARMAEAEKVAAEIGITVEQAQELVAIRSEYQQEIKPKHTDLCLPIGPHDTKKDIRRKSEDLGLKGNLYSNKGFSILR